MPQRVISSCSTGRDLVQISNTFLNVTFTMFSSKLQKFIYKLVYAVIRSHGKVNLMSNMTTNDTRISLGILIVLHTPSGFKHPLNFNYSAKLVCSVQNNNRLKTGSQPSLRARKLCCVSAEMKKIVDIFSLRTLTSLLVIPGYTWATMFAKSY